MFLKVFKRGIKMTTPGGTGQNQENGKDAIRQNGSESKSNQQPPNLDRQASNGNAEHLSSNPFVVLVRKPSTQPWHQRTDSEQTSAGRGQLGHYRGLSVVSGISSRTARSKIGATPDDDGESVYGGFSAPNSERSYTHTQSHLSTQGNAQHFRQASDMSLTIGIEDNNSARGPGSQLGSPNGQNLASPDTMNNANNADRRVPQLEGFESAKRAAAWDNENKLSPSVRSDSEMSEAADPLKKYEENGTIRRLDNTDRRRDVINDFVAFCKDPEQRKLFLQKHKALKYSSETELTNFMIDKLPIDKDGRYTFSYDLAAAIRESAKAQAARPKSAPSVRSSNSVSKKPRSRSVSQAELNDMVKDVKDAKQPDTKSQQAPLPNTVGSSSGGETRQNDLNSPSTQVRNIDDDDLNNTPRTNLARSLPTEAGVYLALRLKNIPKKTLKDNKTEQNSQSNALSLSVNGRTAHSVPNRASIVQGADFEPTGQNAVPRSYYAPKQKGDDLDAAEKLLNEAAQNADDLMKKLEAATKFQNTDSKATGVFIPGSEGASDPSSAQNQQAAASASTQNGVTTQTTPALTGTHIGNTRLPDITATLIAIEMAKNGQNMNTNILPPPTAEEAEAEAKRLQDLANGNKKCCVIL